MDFLQYSSEDEDDLLNTGNLIDGGLDIPDNIDDDDMSGSVNIGEPDIFRGQN